MTEASTVQFFVTMFGVIACSFVSGMAVGVLLAYHWSEASNE